MCVRVYVCMCVGMHRRVRACAGGCACRFAHKKEKVSSKNGCDSESKRLGVKRSDLHDAFLYMHAYLLYILLMSMFD